MNVTPRSTARRAIPIAVDRSGRARMPVSRIAPNPRRWTGRSPIMMVCCCMVLTLRGTIRKDKRVFLDRIA